MTYTPIDERLSEIADELLTHGITLEQAAVAFERKMVATALGRTAGNITQASKALGVHRNTLHNKLRVFGWVTARAVHQRVLLEKRGGRR